MRQRETHMGKRKDVEIRDVQKQEIKAEMVAVRRVDSEEPRQTARQTEGNEVKDKFQDTHG